MKRSAAAMLRWSVLMALLSPLAAFAAEPETTAMMRTDPAAEYHLGTGDKLRVIVFGEDSLGGEFVLGSTGRVALPLIGEVEAQGLTVAQLQDKITAALADGYLTNPRVSVEVLNYRPFYILGEVNKPGEYPFVNGLTVMNAVAQAQGFTYRANTKEIRLKHANQPGEAKEKLTVDTLVGPGDTIIIRERWF